ncbi:hypothetical protein SAMN05192561_10677 [Halopenitus malekzadehii]|uniref:Uncharacterized protein n=1 Tax=Halopenitus malekzadehii TaxID=1267564 RepID=A0A1H6J0E6_9EURY|nr:hypothetical protein [Halopenitus malekzadehii]SEH55373.1 hypothetical protein SAMN05192561_10677 [Halopenitus malekzadehii]
MTREELATDDRAVSTVVGYVLGLIIASLLISGLFVAGGDLLTEQQTAAATTGFEVAGERVATGYADADRLVETADASASDPGTAPAVSVAVPIRSRIAGDGYTVRVTGTGGGDPPYTATIHLENTDGSATYTTRVVTHTPIRDASVAGGPIVIRYDDGDGTLTLERGRIA